jgi:hypothetical protein
MSGLIFVVLGWAIAMVILVFTLPKFTAWLNWRDLDDYHEITWPEYWKRIKEITDE